jgi:c-di-GMP phosphodiesterase
MAPNQPLHRPPHSGTAPGLNGLTRSKRSIIWVLLLLIALSLAGISVMATLNLNYSQKAMAQLRQAQLAEVFATNLGRINAHQQFLEHYTADLARLGELFWHLQQSGKPDQAGELEKALLKKLHSFADAFGAGIWFEPGEFPENPASPGIFAYRQGAEQLTLISPTDGGLQDYRQQPWFTQAMPDRWPQEESPEEFYWTPAYYNPLSEAAVLTLVRPMHAPDGRLIGVVTTDWHADKLTDLVSQVDVTPNTFAYLIDRNNRRISGLSENDDEKARQVMDLILEVRLIDTLTEEEKPALAGGARSAGGSRNHQLTVDGSEYSLSYAATTAGMLFGIGVPRNEIDAVLLPMRTSNLQILAVTGLVMLGLSAVLLFKVIGLMRQLKASYTDELTGLPNRARLLEDSVANPQGSLILVDIDGFKEVNGLFGHRCGDFVLQQLAIWLDELITSEPRLISVRLYRLTSDEFALLGPARPVAELETLVQAISIFLESRSPLWQGQEINLGITLGAALQLLPDSASPRDNLITWAKFALKQARRQHQNYLVYDARQCVEETYEQNLFWAGRVKKALLEDRLFPYFQPIYNNRSGRVSKFECLVRMRGEDGGIISPEEFLEVTRKLRLERRITRIMVDKSFAAFAGEPYDFSINLCCADLLDDELTSAILKKLADTGQGDQVIFEILESDGIEKYSEVRSFIDRAKAHGCRIAIDDFGTGYANFEHLLRLNVDLIKIDGSLVRNLDHDRGAMRITQGIVNFARSLNMSTVAEFVHSARIQEKVVALGIDFSQGAHFGMPRADLLRESAKVAEPA